jgi:DNA transformation protein
MPAGQGACRQHKPQPLQGAPGTGLAGASGSIRMMRWIMEGLFSRPPPVTSDRLRAHRKDASNTMAHDALAAHCIELLAPLGPARARRMFGGHGLYLDDRGVAISAEGKLYLKTSEATRAHFADAGGQPFVYQGSEHRPTVVMSYWTPPAEALESPALMAPWARLAVEAALAARKPKPARSTRASQPTKVANKTRTSRSSSKASPSNKSARGGTQVTAAPNAPSQTVQARQPRKR